MKKSELLYGKWYKCDEIMPEDFEELLDIETSSKEVLIHLNNEEFDISFRRKMIYNDTNSWRWYGYQKVTHWLAIPPINK